MGAAHDVPMPSRVPVPALVALGAIVALFGLLLLLGGPPVERPLPCSATCVERQHEPVRPAGVASNAGPRPTNGNCDPACMAAMRERQEAQMTTVTTTPTEPEPVDPDEPAPTPDGGDQD